jgi:hypothetical protein
MMTNFILAQGMKNNDLIQELEMLTVSQVSKNDILCYRKYIGYSKYNHIIS